jgi:hypothetical protein
MRWYRTCLLEGRAPFFCPEIMHPVGVPLGNFSPLHMQALAYLPLSLLLGQDVLCFNLIWLVGMVFTGLGTFVWLCHVLRDSACAAFGGLLVMLSGPMLQHAQGHLELVYLGSVPLFLMTWVRFVDQPGLSRVGWAVAAYLLVALCAGYYAPLAAVPAGVYLAVRALRGIRLHRVDWLVRRAGWLALFGSVVLPALLFLFGSQIWSVSHGYALDRSLFEYRKYGTEPWTYLAPTTQHALGACLPWDLYAADDLPVTRGEKASYLGVVTWVLVALAVLRRAQVPRARCWWIMFVVVLVLSCGAEVQVGPWRVPLPGAWLKLHVTAFRPIRVPARFNLLAALFASLWAAAGLRKLLASVRGRTGYLSVYTAVVVLAFADLANLPFPTALVPPAPACYAWLKWRDAGAAVLEIPQYGSEGSYLYALCAYWQSQHRGRTNAGYSGQANVRYDNLITRNSPFLAKWMMEPCSAARTGPKVGEVCGAAASVDLAGNAWLFATVHHYDYVILHQWRDAHFDPPHQDVLKERLRNAVVFEDADTVVFERARMGRPARPVVLLTSGWRPTTEGRPCRVAERVARLAVYNPDSDSALSISLEARALHHARTVRLLSGSRVLAQWVHGHDRFRIVRSAAFRLPQGLHELALSSDGEESPNSRRELAWETDRAPYSLRVLGVTLDREPAVLASTVGDRVSYDPCATAEVPSRHVPFGSALSREEGQVHSDAVRRRIQASQEAEAARGGRAGGRKGRQEGQEGKVEACGGSPAEEGPGPTAPAGGPPPEAAQEVPRQVSTQGRAA